MPHKHTRKGEVDKSTIDLPPSQIAKPLSTAKSAASNGIFTTDLDNSNKRRNGPGNKKRKRKDESDDTPKAFQRLMMFAQGKKLPKSLDDGIRPTKAQNKAAKKRKLAEETGEEAGAEVKDEPVEKVELGTEMPTIRPGEKMSDFSARVDAALPVSGLINKTAKGGKDPLGLKVHRTKTEKRMHRMYDEWRQEEARRVEKRQELLEEKEMEEFEEDEAGQARWKADRELEAVASTGGKKKKGKKTKKRVGEVDDGDDDPWAKIKRDRGEVKAGLNDVVLAPPTFSKIPREKFKVRAGAKVMVGDVPKASGSLRRREELGVERRSVVEGYRQMMKERAAAVATTQS